MTIAILFLCLIIGFLIGFFFIVFCRWYSRKKKTITQYEFSEKSRMKEMKQDESYLKLSREEHSSDNFR